MVYERSSVGTVELQHMHKEERVFLVNGELSFTFTAACDSCLTSYDMDERRLHRL